MNTPTAHAAGSPGCGFQLLSFVRRVEWIMGGAQRASFGNRWRIGWQYRFCVVLRDISTPAAGHTHGMARVPPQFCLVGTCGSVRCRGAILDSTSSCGYGSAIGRLGSHGRAGDGPTDTVIIRVPSTCRWNRSRWSCTPAASVLEEALA